MADRAAILVAEARKLQAEARALYLKARRKVDQAAASRCPFKVGDRFRTRPALDDPFDHFQVEAICGLLSQSGAIPVYWRLRLHRTLNDGEVIGGRSFLHELTWSRHEIAVERIHG